MAKVEAEKLIVKNRRATFDYDIKDRYEAGVSLVGSEVKSMRDGKVDVTDAYVAIVGSSRVDLQACKLEYSIVSPK